MSEKALERKTIRKVHYRRFLMRSEGESWVTEEWTCGQLTPVPCDGMVNLIVAHKNLGVMSRRDLRAIQAVIEAMWPKPGVRERHLAGVPRQIRLCCDDADKP